MDAEQDRPGPRSANAPQDGVRRGRGLRLSVSGPPPDEPAPGPPAGDEDEPARRGHGLQLSVHSPVEDEPATAAEPPQQAEETHAPASEPGGGPAERARISFRRAGDGPPLLLLHGWGFSSEAWLGVLPDLAELRACYALDLPGFGRSPPLREPPELATLAGAVLAFADRLGLGRFDLVGHSLGAAVAIHVAAQAPERVARLALTSVGVRRSAMERLALGLAFGSAGLTARLLDPLRPRLEPLATQLLQSEQGQRLAATALLGRAPAATSEWQAGIAALASADPRAVMAYLASATDPRLAAGLVAVAAPTLVLAGRDDRLVPLADARAAAELVPKGQLVVLDGCGHLPHLEQPSAYAAALRSFLAG